MKKNTIIIIILSVLLVIASGFAIYNKVSLEQCEKTSLKNVLNEENIGNALENIVDKGIDFENVIDEIFEEKAIKEKWADFLTNYKKNMPKEIYFDDRTCSSIIATIKDGKLTVNENGTTKELNDNVLFAEFSLIGNGGCNALFFVTEDGNVHEYFPGWENAEALKMQYIVKILSEEKSCTTGECVGGMVTHFIDIEGNVY